MYVFLRWVMRFVTRAYLVGLFHVEGRGNVPLRGGVLVCPNHQSTVDPPMVPAFLPRRDSWSMAKAEYFAKENFTKWLFTEYHAFPVVRHSPDRKALKRAMDVLRDGQVLVVYPEGTRIESGGLRRGEPGAGFLAQTADVPVVPAGLIGTRECFRKGSFWPRRVRVRLVYGRPFRIPGRLEDGSKVDRQDAADAIMLSVAELLPEGTRGEFEDLAAWRAKVGGLRRYE